LLQIERAITHTLESVYSETELAHHSPDLVVPALKQLHVQPCIGILPV
jgi:hypothetical protein